MISNSDKLKSILRHIKRVEDNCNLVASKLMDINPEFALAICKRGRHHDTSKLEGIEFENLWVEKETDKDLQAFKDALKHHHLNNSHHPEYYKDGIYGMSDLDICEMVCDATARLQETGSNVREWFFDSKMAPTKYGYLNDEKMYKKIESFIVLILNSYIGN